MSGPDGQNRRNVIHEKVALYDAHFLGRPDLRECHMFDLCECEHKRQHQIYFTSSAATIHRGCEYTYIGVNIKLWRNVK